MGLWEAILEALNEGAAKIEPAPDRLRMVDSTIVRAHQHAAGAPKKGAGALRARVLAARAVASRPRSTSGSMRGACRCAACVTPGQTSDHRGFDLVMGDDLPAPAALLGDKGYDSDRIRAWAEARDGVPVIPMRRRRKARKGVDRALYALRNRIERCIGRLKHSRRLATRYDKTATSLLGFLDLACIRLWVRDFVNMYNRPMRKRDRRSLD